jgi:hypothetical protein
MAGEGVCERQAHAQGHCCVSLRASRSGCFAGNG